METLSQKVDRFKEYFCQQIKLVGEVPPQKSGLHRKILYTAILDALSKTVFPRKPSSRERYVGFLRQFADWDDIDKVSLLHLVRLIELHPDPAFEDLRIWTLKRFKSLADNTPISSDPTTKEVENLWPKGSEHRKPVGDLTLEHLQHGNLFYRNRNALVHEYHELGLGMEYKEDETPYYQTGTLERSDSGHLFLKSSSMELVYPLPFYKLLCQRSLKALTEYFRQNELSPFAHFFDGTYWIEELN